MPILFRCNELPFRCFASSMFSCSMKCRSFFFSHRDFNSSFTALARRGGTSLWDMSIMSIKTKDEMKNKGNSFARIMERINK